MRWANEANPAFGDCDLLMHAAYRVSLATAQGHLCVTLDRLAGELPHLAAGQISAALLNSGVVGRPEDDKPVPLVLDADGRLYLFRYFDYERRLVDDRTDDSLPAAVGTLLDDLFRSASEASADWQKLAPALALLGRLTVISGGPGTGKTATVANLLACLLEVQPGSRIALAAPTGKASARMLAALRERSNHLLAHLQKQLPQNAFTVHRMLGVRHDGGFRHQGNNPLAIDVLVVDEASMLDLALAMRLIEALPPRARLILLGD